MFSLGIVYNPHRFAGLAAVFILLGLAVSSSASAQQHQVSWHSFEEALQEANQNNKLVVVDVWAPWCGWCHKMKKESYPALPDKLTDQFIFTRLNRDDHETDYKYKGKSLTSMRLAQKLNAQAVPTVVILSPDGDYLFHISGFLNTDKLQSMLLKTLQVTSRQ